MGTTARRHLLKSLDKSSHWNYAVFWKLQHENPMILTWEDGYCNYPKLGESTETVSGGMYFNSVFEIIASNCEASICQGTSGGYPIGQAVADMSCLQYTLGEGIVGEVAFTGNHCWISSDSILAGELDSKLMSEHPKEWLLQFASGIKTVLLVPVLPHGVLQLGSLEMVPEDAALVTQLQETFNISQTDIGDASHFTLNRDFQSELLPLSSLLSSTNILASTLKFEDLDTIDDVKPNKIELLSPFGVGPVENKNGMLEVPEKDLQTEIIGSASHQSIYGSSEMVGSKLFSMSDLEDLLASSHYDASAESSNKFLNSYIDEHMEELPLANMDANFVDYQNLSSSLSFPMDSELHKALAGPAFPRQKNEHFWESFFLVDGTDNISGFICNRNLIDEAEPSLFPEGCNPDHLLEARVGNVSGSLNGTSSKSLDCVRLCPSSSGQFVSSSLQQSQSEAACREESVPQSHVTSVIAPRDRNALTNSTAADSLGSIISTLINEEQRKKGSSRMKLRKGAKASNASKRRVRSGDNPKTRPRDRQMIQDRLKELRELLPDGAKCSIDGLLDKAIKHMLFLRSVTDRAEKLKQWVDHEVTSPRRSHRTDNGSQVNNARRSHRTDTSCQNGTSWALEFDSEFQGCPIMVEDLEYPGHMLIEMLCDDLRVFLEISQVIRDLELTIIKGTMETHSNNSWACFIVEASKGFHRMDIFWPLMQFLQCKRNPISSNM